MDAERKLAQHPIGELGGRQGFRLQLLVDERHDRIGEFVGPFGTTPFGEQTRQTSFLEVLLGLIVGRSGDAKLGSGVGLAGALDAHAPKHLVLDLYDIARIEEGVEVELGGFDALGMGVEHLEVLEPIPFGVASGHRGVCRRFDVNIYMPYIVNCQAIYFCIYSDIGFYIR